MGFELDLVRDVKIAANASSVTVFGKLFVRDIGRWREKKAEAQISVKKKFNSAIRLLSYGFRVTYGLVICAACWERSEDEAWIHLCLSR